MWIGVPAKYHSEARTLCGASWRRRLAVQAAEPARIEELPAKVKQYGKLRITQAAYICAHGSPTVPSAKQKPSQTAGLLLGGA